MGEINYKDASRGIKDVSAKDGIICGYFSNFGTEDSDGDIILPGAFTKTIQENGPDSAKPRIKHLLNHRADQPLGVLQVLKEDAIGLYYESKIGSHSLGKDFLLMAEDGIISEHSIGYQVIKWERDETKNVTKLTELKLWEGSSLTAWGANENTPIVGMKALSFDTLAERMNVIVKALRNGKYSDQGFEMLEYELMQIQKAFKDLSAKPVNEQGQPDNTTANSDNPDEKAIEIITEFKTHFSL